MEPAVECAILEQRTEVVITPKDRRSPSARTSSQAKGRI